MDSTIAGTSVQVLADSAYGSGEMLAALARTAHTPLIKPWPMRPAVQGGFTLDDLTVDEAAGTVTCPHNITRAIIEPATHARPWTDSERGIMGAGITRPVEPLPTNKTTR